MSVSAVAPAPDPITIATRASPLALAQAHAVRDALVEAHGWPVDEARCPVKILALSTKGDRVLSKPLLEIGGKGLFTKEIEDALLDGRAQLAVHSMKDVPTALPPGLEIAAMMTREDPRDVFICPQAKRPEDLPRGALVGTASLRRQAQLLALRPDLRVTALRGNVATRLAKLEAGEVAATFLARAGLNRLGHPADFGHDLAVEAWMPAVAQAAVGIEIRTEDQETRELISAIDDPSTSVCVRAERAFLRVLDGNCRTPIAGHAVRSGDRLHLSGQVLTPDGKREWRGEKRGPMADPEGLGTALGRELKDQMQAAGVDSAALSPGP